MIGVGVLFMCIHINNHCKIFPPHFIPMIYFHSMAKMSPVTSQAITQEFEAHDSDAILL